MRLFQLQILAATSPADRLRVEEILLSAAARFGLFDNTFDSRVLETIRSFSEAEFAGFGLGARVMGERIVVDFNPRTRAVERFTEVRGFVEREVGRAFRGRVRIPNTEDYLGIQETLPSIETDLCKGRAHCLQRAARRGGDTPPYPSKVPAKLEELVQPAI